MSSSVRGRHAFASVMTVVGTGLMLACGCGGAGAQAADLGGRWMTFDADTGLKRSIVEIAHDESGYKGHIVEVYVEPDEPPDPICDVCRGTQHGQKIRGLEILILRPGTNGAGYAGTILDPEEGRVYKCVASISADGSRLVIRGYVGIPALGRSVTWQRIE